MKLNLSRKPSSLSAALILAGLAATAPVSNAAVMLGDLIFGVRDVSTTTPNSNVYLFDLGQPLTTTGQVANSGVVATGLGADLSALFGPDWATNTSLKWSISGYDSNGNLDGSKVESTYGTKSAAYSPSPFGPGAFTTIPNDMNNVVTQFQAGSDGGTAGFPNGGYSALGGDNALKTDANGYASYMPGFTTFGANFEANGFTGQAIDIYNISGNVAGDVVYSGSFTVDPTTGSISYSTSPPITTVPEPGRAALLGLGLIGMLFRRRRSVAVAA
jgi:hypothetical protein